LSVPLASVARELDQYYVVSYRPRHDGDGKLHPIDIRARRAGITLRARQGYWARTPEESAPTARVTERPAPLRIHLSPFIRPWFGMARGSGGRTRLTVTWEPNARRGQRVRAETVTLKATSEEGTVLYDGPLSPVRPGATGAPGAPSRAVFDAPPGRVAVEMAITADTGRALESDVRSIHVPNLHALAVTLSTPEIFRARTAREFDAISADPDAAPVTSRTFSRTERLLVRVAAYGSGRDTPAVTATLLNRLGEPMRDLTVRPGPRADGQVQIDVPLAPLAAGEYRIEVVAREAAGEAKELIVVRVTS
jgi:hypothetical protein